MFKFARTAILMLTLATLVSAVASGRNAAEKGRTVDSGAFGVFVRGQRIATETFRIEQTASSSTTSSEFKLTNGAGKVAQRAEMEISAAGDLKRYEWHELSPGKAHILVEPRDQFLFERLVPDPPDQPVEQPFILPSTTLVTDDYFFSQREVLAWRYLAETCGGTLEKCKPGRSQFGVLIPRQRASIMVIMQYVGPEKVAYRGGERELNRINMKVDDVDWVLYLDGDLKLVRIVVPSEQTEVVRD